MKKTVRVVALCAALLLAAAPGAWAQAMGEAAPDEMAAPESAIISPTGARLNVVQKAVVKTLNGHPAVQFALPANAANLQLSAPGHTIVRWSTTPVLLNGANPLAGRRAQIEKERIETNAALMTVNSRLALWQAPPKSGSAQEISQMQASMQAEMPGLALEQARLERRLRLINEELARMPAASDLGERVRVILAGDVREGTEIELRYSYNHDGCGWEAVYEFNARPEEGSGDNIDARMLAEVWQFTGINWTDTEITLATLGFGPRQPAPLPEWVIDSATPKPEPRPLAGNASARVMKAEAAHLDAAPAHGIAVADTSSVYASWKLAERGLPQGRSRMQISSSAWQAPLQWLARPSVNNSRVWLVAKYDLPSNQAWPAGLAEYSVDGQSVGSGEFQPRGGQATLYFGSDPRVSVKTTTDSRKRGDTGIIRTSKTWTWAWTYTITNQHDKPVRVRVERPAPMIVDQDITVSYKNNPPAMEDRKEHMLYWVVDVPAHGKTEIEHSVTLTSPTRLPLLPDIP